MVEVPTLYQSANTWLDSPFFKYFIISSLFLTESTTFFLFAIMNKKSSRNTVLDRTEETTDKKISNRWHIFYYTVCDKKGEE